MKKTYLLRYETQIFQPLNSDGTTYIMYLEHVWFWGWFKTNSITHVEIGYYDNYGATFKKWDKMISDHIPL
jgi:hypothetical protein